MCGKVDVESKLDWTIWPKDGFALVISGSPAGVSLSLLRDLATRASFVIAADSGARWALDAGIGLDVLLGDLDSIDSRTLVHFRGSRTGFVEFDTHKDATDIELVFNYLEGKGYATVVATNMLGGRIDQTLTATGSFARPRGFLPWIIEDDVQLVFLQAEGACSKLVLERDLLAADHQFSIVPIGGSACVSAHGVEWELDKEELSPHETRGVSNVVTEHSALVRVHRGIIAVVIPS